MQCLNCRRAIWLVLFWASLTGLLADLPIAIGAPAHIVLLGSGGTDHKTILRGRVYKGRAVPPAADKLRVQKALETARLFTRPSLPNATVEVTVDCKGQFVTTRTDSRGFFEAALYGLEPGRHVLHAIASAASHRSEPIESTAQVVKADHAGLLVLSDFDMTVADTGVSRNSLVTTIRGAFQSDDDMHAIQGAADTLRDAADRGMPIAYVSASPIEIAPRISRWLANNEFPPGLLFLRDLRIDGMGSPVGLKLPAIDQLLTLYDQYNAILIGDNVGTDPQAYQLAKARHRERKIDVLIRNVPGVKDSRPMPHKVFTDWRQVDGILAQYANALTED